MAMRENRQCGPETANREKQLPQGLTASLGVTLKVVERRIGIGNLPNEAFQSVEPLLRKVRIEAPDVFPRPDWVSERDSLEKWVHRF